MGMRRVSSRALEVVAGLGLLAFARVAAGNSINTDLSLTVAANGCSGFELNSLPQKFGYDLLVEAWSLGACEASSVRYRQPPLPRTRTPESCRLGRRRPGTLAART